MPHPVGGSGLTGWRFLTGEYRLIERGMHTGGGRGLHAGGRGLLTGGRVTGHRFIAGVGLFTGGGSILTGVVRLLRGDRLTGETGHHGVYEGCVVIGMERLCGSQPFM